MMAGKRQQPIVLFDGVCGLCNGAVKFIIRRDRNKRFLFAPLQSDIGQELLKRHGLPQTSWQSLALIDNGQAFAKSAAVLRICRLLPGLWPVLYAGVALPSPIRDAIYDWVARNRYRWFGKQDACMMPYPEWRDRFLT